MAHFKISGKRGSEKTLEYVIVAVIFLIAAFVVIMILQKSSSPLFTKISAYELESNQRGCLQKGIENPNLLINDDDKYPNSCDACPWCDSSVDSDADYMPDCCDKDPDNARVFECISGMDKEKFQCKKPAEAVKETQQERKSQEKLNADAQKKYEQALSGINSKNYLQAYSLVKDILANYKATAVYDYSVMQFSRFELFFENNNTQLMQFYRDALQLGFTEYETKMGLAYKNRIMGYLNKGTVETVEVAILPQFEYDLDAFTVWNTQTKDIAAEIYYKIASAFLDKGKKDKAIIYYKKAFEDYPDAFYAKDAKIAYDRLTSQGMEGIPQEEPALTDEERGLIELNNFKREVTNAFLDKKLWRLENEIIPLFEANLALYTTRTKVTNAELIAEIYYKIARTFEINNMTNKALPYYQKIFQLYSNTVYAKDAKTAYDRLSAS